MDSSGGLAEAVLEQPAAFIASGPLAGTAVAPFAAWLGIVVHEAAQAVAGRSRVR